MITHILHLAKTFAPPTNTNHRLRMIASATEGKAGGKEGEAEDGKGGEGKRGRRR